ncbi:cation-translocating P-type ATPase [Candidatus Mycolicibacterium alkanivorans]|uniref:Cation-transporting P-type ATPase n=1 Tax=Candidatus Mycolicibacterium alkanivorans TaxID=2954114 RepID=A0ABS9YSD6_9MYCO|nr:cation-transporting P-type ATPase [Candidatus Mycolicibacterium alkanivorans]MCI4674127.1 cation-transporting P-type ATPase [Candidatus Mycolicibacterium alkanivorans]
MTGPRGLTSAEAARRLAAEGPNTLPVRRKMPAWRLLVSEMVHFFALLFWVAGGLAFLAGMPQLGIAVFAVIVLNGVFAFAQEQKAEHAAERLRGLLPRQVTVVRDATTMQVPAEDLVTHDAVLLAEGDRICADLRLDTVHALAVDTSALSGESVPEHPAPADHVYAGCFIVEGEAHATVVATGARTRLAGIAKLTQTQRPPPTPLRRELDRVSRIIAAVAIAVGVGFFSIALLLGTPAADGFLFAVGVTVAVVPEGLLPTVTLSLAMGAQRMAEHRALVRHLEAVETLGSTTFICTDKTGTLTQNEMSVVEIWMPDGTATVAGNGYEPTGALTCTPPACRGALTDIALAARRCSTGHAVMKDGQWIAQGDPMEAALDAFARRAGVDIAAEIQAAPERARFPFDARRRRMSVVVGNRVLVKGAPDAIVSRCRPAPAATEALARLAGRGLRVIAVATRAFTGALPTSADEAETDLTLLGLVALEDPPRPKAAAALAACRRAGIRVAMITGDHPDTAGAIAREVGLAGSSDRVLVGHELPADRAQLGELLDRDGTVVARVTPEDKLRIAEALGARGHVVAMTGDGVNDAPALQEAAIGVAMGRSGTDVAREAADLVLLDDDFSTIVAAVEQGRSTFANIRRFLTYHLTDNVAELAPFIMWALSGGAFPLAIGVLQVLALDIGTDVLPALALGAEPPARHVLDRPPTRGHLIDRSLFARAFAILGSVEAIIGLGAFVVSFLAAGWWLGEPFPTGAALLAASGATFTAIVFGQVSNAFACRSTVRFAWQIPLRSNRLLIGAVAAELAMLAAFLYIAPLAHLLGQSPPSGAGVLAAALAAPAVLAADTLQKRITRSAKQTRRIRPKTTGAIEHLGAA